VDTQAAQISKKRLWAGRVISAPPALLLFYCGVMMMMNSPSFVEGLTRVGFPASVVAGIGITAFGCAVLYVIPRTSVFGAILLTAYLGGATATHVRVGEPIYLPVVVGVLVWVGLCLRDERVGRWVVGGR
jgi:hypothetical protein